MPRACCSAGQCWQSWRWSNRDLPKDSKLHHPKIVIIAWHISPIKENCDPLRQKFNIEVSQFPRACPDSGPSSFLLAKQTLRRPHEKSNRLPQNSCKLRMSQDFNRRPQSIRTLVGSITERRVLATDFNLVSQAFCCPCHEASRENIDSSKNPSVWICRPWMSCVAWPQDIPCVLSFSRSRAFWNPTGSKW